MRISLEGVCTYSDIKIILSLRFIEITAITRIQIALKLYLFQLECDRRQTEEYTYKERLEKDLRTIVVNYPYTIQGWCY